MFPEEGHPHRWAILLVLIVGEFVVELDTTIVTVALPDVAGEFAAGTSALQWVVDAYILTFAGLLLLSGALGDRWGYRRVLCMGLALFALGSLVAAVSPSIGVLIGSRAFMGIGAALILPTTLATLTRVFPAGERAKALSMWAATGGLSFVLGPVVGGALVDAFGWPAIFVVNLPIAAVAVAGILRYVPAGSVGAGTAPDVTGAALSIAGLGTLVFAIVEAPRHGWTSTGTLVELALAALCLAAFVAWEIRAKAPMLDMGLFRSRSFSATAIAAVLTFLAVGGVLFVLTLELQEVHGHSALGAGVRLLPVALMLVVFSPASVVLEQRVGAKVTVGLGLGLIAVGLGLLAPLEARESYTNIAIALGIAGAGYGLTLTPLIDTMTAAASLSRVGATFGVANAIIVVGFSLGVAIIGSIVSTRYGHLIGPSQRGLPGDAADAIRGSVGQALGVARELHSAPLAAAARDAFSHGAARGFGTAAAIAAAGAAVVTVFLPARPYREARVQPDAAPAAAESR
ncbi:MAG TPA: MFS transporter [Thermoleophilaceae bacterium]